MTRRVRLWQIQATDRALKFNTMPPGDKGREVWIPRSQIDHVSRDRPLDNGWIPCTVTVQEWIADKENI